MLCIWLLFLGTIHYFLQLLNIPVHIREICVFLAPVFSGLTAIMAYLFTKEIWNDQAGLFAACFLAIGMLLLRDTRLIHVSVAIAKHLKYIFSSRLHQSVCCRQLRQRRYRNFCPPPHLLSVDQGSQNRRTNMECAHCIGLFLHGIRLGWLRIYYQSDSSARVCPMFDRSLLHPNLHRLHRVLHSWSDSFHAGSFRRLPAS